MAKELYNDRNLGQSNSAFQQTGIDFDIPDEEIVYFNKNVNGPFYINVTYVSGYIKISASLSTEIGEYYEVDIYDIKGNLLNVISQAGIYKVNTDCNFISITKFGGVATGFVSSIQGNNTNFVASRPTSGSATSANQDIEISNLQDISMNTHKQGYQNKFPSIRSAVINETSLVQLNTSVDTFFADIANENLSLISINVFQQIDTTFSAYIVYSNLIS